MANRRNARQRADELAAALNQERAVELRRAGWNLRAIGREIGVSHETVRQYVLAALAESAAATAETTEELRIQENERLDAIQSSLWDGRGDQKVASTLIALSRQRAAINGLNRPTEVKVTGDLANHVDVSKLSPDQLEQLDKLLDDAGIE